MTILTSKTRKVAAALVAAVAIGSALAPTAASAKGGKHHHHGHGFGYGAAAFGGGLLLGALAASSARADYRECWTEKRKSYDGFGGVYISRVRVCD